MRTYTAVTAAVLLAAALTACSSGSDKDAPAKPGAQGAAAGTPQTTATAAAVKLSTTWVPKLEALADGSGVTDCSTDSGSADCVQAISDSVGLFTQIIDAISTSTAADQYPKTVAEVDKLVGGADTYNTDGCPGDENADVDGSPCPKTALAVVVGVSTLQMVMQTDEVNAGL